MSEDKDYEMLCANLKEVMATAQGQNILWEILSMCGIYTDNAASNEPSIEGKRSVGLSILQFMDDSDPTMYARLILTKQSEMK